VLSVPSPFSLSVLSLRSLAVFSPLSVLSLHEGSTVRPCGVSHERRVAFELHHLR
jgi:hypothetical protein